MEASPNYTMTSEHLRADHTLCVLLEACAVGEGRHLARSHLPTRAVLYVRLWRWILRLHLAVSPAPCRLPSEATYTNTRPAQTAPTCVLPVEVSQKCDESQPPDIH